MLKVVLLFIILGVLTPPTSAENAGMQIRLEQDTIEGLKKSMVRFLPRYIDLELVKDFPTTYNFTFATGIGLFDWHFRWSNIQYSRPKLDIMDCQMNLTRSEQYQQSLIKIDFPAIKSWEIAAHQELNTWFLPSGSQVEFYFKNFGIVIDADLVLDENQYLDPIVRKAKFNLGDSYLHHDDFIQAFFLHQTIFYTIKIVENSIWWVGKEMFTAMLGPLMDEMLNHYEIELELQHPIAGQGSKDKFKLDYRNVRNPNIQQGFVDFFFVGEVLHNKHTCQIEADKMDFMNTQTFSQLVISESAATCIANSWAHSLIGVTRLDAARINQMFNTSGLSFDTSSVLPNLKIFQQRLGPNVPLMLKTQFQDVKVLFGQYDSNILLEYTLVFEFYSETADGYQLLIYDSLDMMTSLNMKSDYDLVYPTILNHKVVHDQAHGVKKYPIENKLDMSTAEYREFMSGFGFWMTQVKDWLNKDVFTKGLKFPYGVDEFKSKVYFKEKSMHLTLEVEKFASKYFEDNYWE